MVSVARTDALAAARDARMYFAFPDLEVSMAKYGKSASKNVERTMRRRKKGSLRSSSGQKVKSRKQAIAIGLSEARRKGAKVPSRKSSSGKRKGSRSRSRAGR
jgi:hypothetical protein